MISAQPVLMVIINKAWWWQWWCWRWLILTVMFSSHMPVPGIDDLYLYPDHQHPVGSKTWNFQSSWVSQELEPAEYIEIFINGDSLQHLHLTTAGEKSYHLASSSWRTKDSLAWSHSVQIQSLKTHRHLSGVCGMNPRPRNHDLWFPRTDKGGCSSPRRMNLPFFCLFIYNGLLTDTKPCLKGYIYSTQFINVNADLFQKHLYRHTQIH